MDSTILSNALSDLIMREVKISSLPEQHACDQIELNMTKNTRVHSGQ